MNLGTVVSETKSSKWWWWCGWMKKQKQITLELKKWKKASKQQWMKQKYSRWQKCQAWKGKSKTTSLNRWYQSLCKEWMQSGNVRAQEKKQKQKNCCSCRT